MPPLCKIQYLIKDQGELFNTWATASNNGNTPLRLLHTHRHITQT
jgi:hypothetical protein